jgi:hypothetical protein
MSFPYFFVLCPYPSVRIPTANYTFSDFLRLDHISYFHCALVGYFVGLFAATFSSEVSHEAQPALLFLVPFTLVPLSLMAYMKGDLGLMWNEPFSYTVASKHLYVWESNCKLSRSTNFEYRKTCIFAPLFLRTIINIFIQVIFPNIITYLDRSFKKKRNDINFKMK